MLFLKLSYYSQIFLRKYITKFIQMFSFLYFRFLYFFNFFVVFFFFILNNFVIKKTKLNYFLLLFFIRVFQKKIYLIPYFFFLVHRFCFKYFCFEFIFFNFIIFTKNYFYIHQIKQLSRNTLSSVLRSPFIYKKSYEQFGFIWSTRLLVFDFPFFCKSFVLFFVEYIVFYLNTFFLKNPVLKIFLKENFLFCFLNKYGVSFNGRT